MIAEGGFPILLRLGDDETGGLCRLGLESAIVAAVRLHRLRGLKRVKRFRDGLGLGLLDLLELLLLLEPLLVVHPLGPTVRHEVLGTQHLTHRHTFTLEQAVETELVVLEDAALKTVVFAIGVAAERRVWPQRVAIAGQGVGCERDVDGCRGGHSLLFGDEHALARGHFARHKSRLGFATEQAAAVPVVAVHAQARPHAVVVHELQQVHAIFVLVRCATAAHLLLHQALRRLLLLVGHLTTNVILEVPSRCVAWEIVIR